MKYTNWCKITKMFSYFKEKEKDGKLWSIHPSFDKNFDQDGAEITFFSTEDEQLITFRLTKEEVIHLNKKLSTILNETD